MKFSWFMMSVYFILAFVDRWGLEFAFVYDFSNNSSSINASETRYARRE